MKLTRTEEEGVTVLTIEGAIVLGESGRELSHTLAHELENGSTPVLLELSGINYMDSTGVGELVGYLSRFNDAGRRLALVRPSKRICMLLEIAGIAALFETYEELEEALAGVRSEADR